MEAIEAEANDGKFRVGGPEKIRGGDEEEYEGGEAE